MDETEDDLLLSNNIHMIYAAHAASDPLQSLLSCEGCLLV